VVPEIDIWHAAKPLIRKHAEACSGRARHLILARGDGEDRLFWIRIGRAITELQELPPVRVN
jgi:hypothetical protein